MRFLTLFCYLFLISCGGGEGSNGPISLNQQTDASNQTSNSNQTDASNQTSNSNNLSSSQSSSNIVKENRFGECAFGECKFE
ncbi:hypothetical protein OA184_00900 [SAR86 cluster bacterium]|nr:hypothetical protein [SAR86 cluster bacterium]